MVPATKSDPSHTREKILDAAELLFIERGFFATSMRAIANLAQVNLAATNYHFGSKEGLYAAAIHRCVEPLNKARLTALDQLEAGAELLTIEHVLTAFFGPFSEGVFAEKMPQLMGRLYAEPASLTRPVLEGEFSHVSERFIAALAALLPEVMVGDLRWRFHFLIGAQNHFLNFDRPIGMEGNQESRKQKIEKLIGFVAAGLKQIQQEAVEL